MNNADVATRIEDENRHIQALEPVTSEFTGILHWKEPHSDDELDESKHYDVLAAWGVLFSLHSCQRLMVSESIQKNLQIVVGVNVSQEFPWKQIKLKYLRDHLFDYVNYGIEIEKAMRGYSLDQKILIGYAPLLTQNQEDMPDGDPFIFFIDSQDAKTALSIIRNIEMYEQWVMRKRLVKKPKPWNSLGSEDEVNLGIPQEHDKPVDVEIQSVYPLKIPAKKAFEFRRSGDVRDGYVELVPTENMKFDNVTRRRQTVGIQSAPQCVEMAIQTTPTFPTNAWSQYLYEIPEGDEGLDASSEEEEDEQHKKDRQSVSKPTTPATIEPPVPKPPPELSPQIKMLLDTLEFNQIDLYRNDYPLIAARPIQYYTNPFLEEMLCFADISKSVSRYVCCVDWYQKLAGLIVCSYTFGTLASVEHASRKDDVVQRAVLEPNPILMWSFSDNLLYKLEFESPREITALAFCPLDSNILIGGASNGQIIIWDLQNRADNLDVEEILTPAQSRYRFLIQDFLKWTIQVKEDAIIPPVIVTSLELSQKAAITGIYWLGSQFYMTSFGKLYKDQDKSAKHRYFMTSSFDGTVMFWNLNALTERKVAGSHGARSDQPKALTQSESALKNKVLKPVFSIAFAEPITGLVGDTSLFQCQVFESARYRKNPYNYAIKFVSEDPDEIRQSLLVSSFYGRIERLNWVGVFAEMAQENVQTSVSFARVHDGPVVAIRKNPFYRKVFASIGRNILAVWKEDYSASPIFWRRRICDITALAWSQERPAVLFITRIDGNLEAWDILARDDDACMNEILGGGVVTVIAEHLPTEPSKVLGIGDYNSSFRMVKLPKDFYVIQRRELQRLKEYVSKEVTRKTELRQWEQEYYEKNKDFIEAKRQAEREAHKEMERIQKEQMLQAARKEKEEADQKKSEEQPLSRLPYPERMQRQWDELNLNRLLSILMSRKRVDAVQLERETKLEKERLAYEAAKKESLARTIFNVGEEVAKVRARILPVEKRDMQRSDMIMSLVEQLMVTVDPYTLVEEESDEIIQGFASFDDITYTDFLQRGNNRRRNLNKSLGGNTQRLHWYDTIKKDNVLADCDWGYEFYVNAQVELMTREEFARMNEETPEIEYSDSVHTVNTLAEQSEYV